MKELGNPMLILEAKQSHNNLSLGTVKQNQIKPPVEKGRGVDKAGLKPHFEGEGVKKRLLLQGEGDSKEGLKGG